MSEQITEIEAFSEILVNAKNQEYMALLSQLVQSVTLYHQDRGEGKDLNKKQSVSIFSYNPILIKGKTGTGKSFLLSALSSALGKHCAYYHMLELAFLRDNSKLVDFFEETEKYSCLLFDDVHILADNISAQEDLAFCIERLIAKDKIVIISINNEVRHKELILELQSRISMGLIINIAEPDLDIKMRYAQYVAEKVSLKINKDTALVVARKCLQYRAIQGAITNIKNFYEQAGHLPDNYQLDRILSDGGLAINLNYEKIIQKVADSYGYSVKDIKGKKRNLKLVEARQVAMYLCRQLLGEAFSDIGKAFGGKDHTTVIYGVRKIEEIIVRNKDMHIVVTKITNACKLDYN